MKKPKKEGNLFDEMLKENAAELFLPLIAKECELNKCRFLTGYFVHIFHFKTLKISTFMRLSKQKL